MTTELASSQLELATTAGLVDPRGRRLHQQDRNVADTEIVIHLGPTQTPEVIHLMKSRWPTATALNYSEGREFHMRLRRHITGVYVVYGSVSRGEKTKHLRSIFAEVVQRGRLCRNLQQVELAIGLIRSELGLAKPGIEKT